ncbi:MAG: hypothetical protein EZS28_031493, partial [Streblomastix strix]
MINEAPEPYNREEIEEMLDKKQIISDQIDACTKQEDDALLLLKADKTQLIDAYSNTEADALLDDKLNISDQIDVYNKQKDDALLLLKTDKTELKDAYSKTEDDALLLLKADKTELADNVDLTSAQTITGQKQFNSNVHDAAFAKTGKNDASILLSGGGDILISSLVSQPQLQEVRDIASGKSKKYVFTTTDEMNTWMEDQEKVTKLAIGYNLYIEDKQVIDYRWDGTGLRALEIELPDMSNVKTIHGAATGGCNAIIDLSFNGNTLIPAKNSSFFMINYDETITDQKTFYVTIHSVGIIVQNYDNNSVVSAGGGVSYIKGEDDALLLLKDDKTQLIDACTKEEADNLLNNNADSGVSYTKRDDDALLLLKMLIYVAMTLGTSWKITANKTFNNACRFISSIDGMSFITGSSFVKSGADDSAILLGAGGTNPISEFSNQVDDSNYEKIDSDVQDIQRILRKTALDQLYPEITDDNYITLGAIKSEFISFIYSGSINSNLTATQFIKSGKDDISVLLAGSGDRLLSDFSSGGATVEILTSQDTIIETSTVFNQSSRAFVKLDNLYLFQLQATPKQEGFAPRMDIKIGTLPTQYAPTVSELCMPVGGPYGGFKPHITNTGEIRCYTVGASWIEQISFSGLQPIGELPQNVLIGDKTLQQQVKNKDDITNRSGDGSNEEFEQSVINAITKLDLNSQLKRQSFLASSGQDPQLIVYSDRITLTASYATAGLFQCGSQLG